jgi:uncharacterized Zn finger protein (UPF0148 family)
MKKHLHCANCKKVLEGRTGKRFCDPYCKSNFHYLKNKEKEQSVFKHIDQALKRNRRILKDFNKAGKATVREEILIGEGFNPKFFTHYWRNSKGQAYLFCYEFGFMKITENNRTKYSLVIWQSYMER